ncbi:MAG: hypothetical protein EXX96DRAFT_579783 [Benjaminiella poitrasii]|nr:MAG: hypothetical protein EXX96DRAFT_579783 [Benjaminiella poitrasii]
MSTISVKNDILPSFAPIEQKTKGLQTRKRNAAALKDASSNSDSDEKTTRKRSRAKRGSSPKAASSVTINKPVIIWIGASLKQQETTDKEDNNSSLSIVNGAFSIYYGLNDGRNYTEKVILTQNQNLEYIYTMGVIRALEKCKDDSSALFIHTGSQIEPQPVSNNSAENICNKIQEIISNRKGSTSISCYKDDAFNFAQPDKEYQAAHKLATEKLYELDEDVIMANEPENGTEGLPVVKNGHDKEIRLLSVVNTIIKEEEESAQDTTYKLEPYDAAIVSEEKEIITSTLVSMNNAEVTDNVVLKSVEDIAVNSLIQEEACENETEERKVTETDENQNDAFQETLSDKVDIDDATSVKQSASWITSLYRFFFKN